MQVPALQKKNILGIAHWHDKKKKKAVYKTGEKQKDTDPTDINTLFSMQVYCKSAHNKTIFFPKLPFSEDQSKYR